MKFIVRMSVAESISISMTGSRMSPTENPVPVLSDGCVSLAKAPPAENVSAVNCTQFANPSDPVAAVSQVALTVPLTCDVVQLDIAVVRML